MTYEEMIKDARARMAEAGIDDPATDAFMLLGRAAGKDIGSYYAILDQRVPGRIKAAYEELLQQRLTRKPLQLILGDTVFMGLTIKLDGKELIPRPDTEILVQEALEVWHERYDKGEKELRVLDMCTGSGCVAIALAHYGKFGAVCAGDISEEALANARGNAAANKAEIDFRQGDLFAPFAGEKFDIITANPPYIKSGDMAELQTEVRDYDPALALDGGADGLDFYRRIAKEADAALSEGGCILLEIGCEQAAEVKEIFHKAGYSKVKAVKDYAGLDRIVICRK